MDTIPKVKASHTPTPPPGLAEHHAEYLEARAVDPTSAGGVFWTARRPSEIPSAFSERQRRGGEALIAQFLSPDGVTVGYQARFNRPRPDARGRVAKWVSPPSERARIVLGVVEEMLEEVRSGTRPLWVVEGATRGAALFRYGIPAVFMGGCWNWQTGGEPLECWHHVNLKGRLVLVALDADWRTNELVHEAQAQLVALLEERGASVRVVDVPEIEGDESTGLDDALAAGVSPHALEREARPFRRVDVGRERLGRDERLWRFVRAKRSEVEELPARGAVECNARKVARYLVGTSASRGKIRECGVEVYASLPQIAEGVRLGSYQTVQKALVQLQSVGFLERVDGPRAPREATRYLLLYPSRGGSTQGVNIGTGQARGGEGQEQGAGKEREQENPLPQRESYARLHSTHTLPPLRNSKLVHTYARRSGRGRVVVSSEYFWRYGAKREEIFRYILERAGAEPAELWRKFGSQTSRLGGFLKTWVQPMINDGVLVGPGAVILPAADWPEALERVRERTDEDEDNRLQSERYARRRRQYRDYLEKRRRGEDTRAEKTPQLFGRERVARLVGERAREDEERRVEAERQKVGTTAAVFLSDALEGISGLRWRELLQRWRERGGKLEGLQRAVRTSDAFDFRREDSDGELYVYRRELLRGGLERETPASVAVLHDLAPPRSEPEPAEEEHPWHCDCAKCAPAPSYVRPIGGAS